MKLYGVVNINNGGILKSRVFEDRVIANLLKDWYLSLNIPVKVVEYDFDVNVPMSQVVIVDYDRMKFTSPIPRKDVELVKSIFSGLFEESEIEEVELRYDREDFSCNMKG